MRADTRAFASASSPATNRPGRLSGPRELAIATSWPAPTKRCAAVPPILPLPMIPMRTSGALGLGSGRADAGRPGARPALAGAPAGQVVDVLRGERHLA